MTPRSLILMKAFWFCGRFSEAMSFSRFALLSQKSQITYRKLSIVWLSRVNCQFLLCKAKPAWIIKRSNSLRNFAAFTIRGSYSKKFLPIPQTWLLIQKEQILKLHCLRKMALESKRLHQNFIYFCNFSFFFLKQIQIKNTNFKYTI